MPPNVILKNANFQLASNKLLITFLTSLCLFTFSSANAQPHEHKHIEMPPSDIVSTEKIPGYVTVRYAREDKSLAGMQILHFYAAIAANAADETATHHLNFHWSSLDFNETQAIVNYIADEYPKLLDRSKKKYQQLMCSGNIDKKKLHILEDIADNQRNQAFLNSFDKIATKFGIPAYEDVSAWKEKTTADLVTLDTNIDAELEDKGISPDSFLSQVCNPA